MHSKADTRWVWIAPLLVTLGLQMAAAYILRVVPTLAPALAQELGWGEGTAGFLASIGMVGSIVFLLIGSPLTRRFGPVRASQIGLLISAAGAVMLSWPTAAVAVLASFFIGFGYGPSTPAGTDILHRYTPAARRNLVFSIKQAGVPIGGVLAGMVLPVALVQGGWPAVLGAVLLPTLIVVLATQALRGQVDAGRDIAQAVGLRTFLALDNIRTPLLALARSPELLKLSFAGVWLSIGHGCWVAFLVSFAVIRMGYSLEMGGVIFAIMQLTGIFGRIVLGALADRANSVAVLRANTVASAVTTLALVFAAPDWPLAALVVVVGIAGVTVSSWNGVQVAEISRRAPAGLVAEATAGATLLIFAGYVFGPICFSLVLSFSGRFDVAFALVALATLLALWNLRGLDR
ncbi:MFS transporter [Bosea caraganae]|uniref:MFS transporter n=1 Tax=Bosea caraganae TaxID=2763117 RepID=A0A370L961_9HYPH|nr:MFS transporter [Bosea caraganae]RDJ26938.1 MFS transporter [Bosea caraganae]RDJ30825.1 MFS transporter [Bosea caraganae]